MRKSIIETILLSALLSVSASCSVKEDREPCPCRFSLDLGSCSKYADRVSLKGWYTGTPVIDLSVPKVDFNELLEMEVPHGYVSYCALSGMDKSVLTDWRLTIPEGEQADRIYAYFAKVDTDCEEAYDKVSLHKEYCKTSFRFTNMDTDNPLHLDIRVRGYWNGLLIDTFEPHRGSFIYAPAVRDDGSWTFNLPRQGDESLLLDIFLDGSLQETYPLGEYIVEKGYDWRKQSLDDLSIEMDLKDIDISVRILPWQSGNNYDEIL